MARNKTRNRIIFWAIVAGFIIVLGIVSLSILGIMAGAKFGPLNGFAVTGVSISINLILSWWIARKWLRGPVQKILRKVEYKMPEMETNEYAGVCILTALIPGPSYTLKNYFLALSNLPFRIIFWIGLPAHSFAASPGILFGDFTGAMTWKKAVFLGLYTLLLLGVSHYLVHKIRSRKKRGVAGLTDERRGPKSAADDRTQHA